MAAIILILRPQPGADVTAARARDMGLEARLAPLFTIKPLDWEPPDAAEVDGILLTSGNAARLAGPAIGSFVDLPCYAVGEATALAAEATGFTKIKTGRSDGAAGLALAAGDNIQRMLHLCGRDHIALEHPKLTLIRRFVYAAEPVAALYPEARQAISEGAIALLHSPRAAATFASLVDAAAIDRASIRVAAISPAALAAGGGGWGAEESATSPRDEALLELAAKLCKT